MGIDPDARHEADASANGDSATSDAAGDVRNDATGGDAGGSDAAIECQDAGDCAALERYACEKAICDTGHCALVSRDGERIVEKDGFCRGYACIGANVAFGTSGATTCIVAQDGLVWCWGNDASGQLGDGKTTARSTPYLVPRIGDDLAGASMVGVGPDHACALLTDQTIVCWGANAFGQSTGEDAGGATAPIGPTEVHEAPISKGIAVGFGSTCALGTAGDVWCWGDNSSGQLGLGSSAGLVVSRPSRISLLSQINALSGSVRTVCAAPGSGPSLACWGDNTWGQVGPNCVGTRCPFPVTIEGNGDDSEITDVGYIATTWGNVCVTSGPRNYLQCWGNDRAGQLGNGRGVDFFGDGGSGDTAFPTPNFVSSDDGGTDPAAAAMVVGANTHFCAQEFVTRDFFCWGENSNGELGDKLGFFSQPFHATVFDHASQVALGDEHACMLRALTSDDINVSCLGRAELGQTGDGLPITDHLQATPVDVKFPSPPGGVAALRASE